MSDENQRSACEIDPSSDDSSSNNSVHHDREHEIHAPRSDRESSFESTQTGFSSTPSAHATGSDQFGMPGQPTGSNQFVDPNQSAGFGQPTGVMQAPRQLPHKTKRFSTPAVAALILAAAVASGAVTGAVVSNRDSGSSSDNSSAVSALKASPAKTKNVDTNGSVQSVAQKVLPSVVSITVEAGNSGDTGSGSIISEDGTIITNNHVIAGAANGGKISVTLNDGTTYPANIVARDPETDIAVIKAQGASGLTPISLGDSSKLEVGQEV
ncbi:MAG: trypsin-like peptidase domain-containing protein, partial [Corynebacterium kroppenstedtii]|nr:trypsin-like peptidase domain-containing protein [Corynebacterium kroppenstedtii]